MKKRESKIEIKSKTPNIVEIDGKKYFLETEKYKKIDGVEHSDRLVFKKFDEEQYKKNLQIVIDAISKRTTKRELLQEILGAIETKSLKKLVKRIKQKKPIKKYKGCLGFKIGDAYLQLIE